jgi:TRAP-type C4-dicarboxylate transport system permease small subunit
MEGVHLEAHHSVPADWPAPMRWLTKVSSFLAVAEGVAIGLCLAVVIFMFTWQCIERNLVQAHHWFFRVPAWGPGFTRHAVFMLAFLGGAYATYTGRHIRFDAISRTQKGRRKLMLRAFTTACAITMVSLFTWGAWGFYKVLELEAEEASQAHEIFTPSRGAMIMVIGYGVIAFHFFVEWCIDVGWLLSKQEPPASWVADAGHGGEISGDAPVAGS